MPNPVVFVPDNGQVAYDWIALNTSTDIDFTDPDGPTGGICPRGIAATVAGNVVATFTGAPGGMGVTPPTPAAATLPFAAKETKWGYYVSITSSGTTATGLFAIL